MSHAQQIEIHVRKELRSFSGELMHFYAKIADIGVPKPRLGFAQIGLNYCLRPVYCEEKFMLDHCWVHHPALSDFQPGQWIQFDAIVTPYTKKIIRKRPFTDYKLEELENILPFQLKELIE